MFLLFYILSCYGLTQILVYGTIFNSIRPKQGLIGELFKCPMCIGFHVGYVVSILLCGSELYNISFNFIDMFLMACLSSGTSYVLCSIFNDFGINFKINKSESE